MEEDDVSKTAPSSSEVDAAKTVSPAESNAYATYPSSFKAGDDVIKGGGGSSSVKGGSSASDKIAAEEKFRSDMAIFWTMPPPKEFMNRHNQVKHLQWA